MLEALCDQVLEAADVAALVAALGKAMAHIGFKTFGGALVPDPVADGTPGWLEFYDMPQAYVELDQRGLKDALHVKRDPVLRHLKDRSTPIAWTQCTYARSGTLDLWDVQASYGLKAGIAAAMHLPKGRHFLLGGETDQPQLVQGEQGVHIVGQFQVLMAFAHEAAERVFLPSLGKGAHSLSARELEVLRWTAEGKSAWDISVILSLSEHTVSNHLRHAVAKLECVSKTHATAKAVRLGYI